MGAECSPGIPASASSAEQGVSTGCCQDKGRSVIRGLLCEPFSFTLSSCCTQAFEEWNKTELDSFLIEITANILKFRDADGKHLLPKIRDSAGQKGTGKWTAISALEYGVPVTLIGNVLVDPPPSCFLLMSFWSSGVD